MRPLPGAVELLATLTAHGVPWAIATSGVERYARRGLDLLGLPADTPLVTRDQVRYAKPDPDLFLTAAELIGVDILNSVVVGDSVWDLLAARRARALGIGLLSGGYGREELIYSGAFRVYEDPRGSARASRRGRRPPAAVARSRGSSPARSRGPSPARSRWIPTATTTSTTPSTCRGLGICASTTIPINVAVAGSSDTISE